jgi:type VI secretion system protein ImpM
MSVAPVTDEGEARLGFYGKLPVRGDFIGRRLDRGFVDVWHGWVQECIACSREQLGEAWQSRYLSAPLWRFLMGPGVCGPAAFAGVLMASVDRVGRCFPLLLAVAVPAPPAPVRAMHQADTWFAEIEDLALAGLAEDLDPEAYDAAAAKIVPPDLGSAVQPAEPPVGLVLTGEPAATGLSVADCYFADLTKSYSLWSTVGAANFEPVTVGCRGLPAPRGFAALLDGGWARWGWKIP